MNNHKRYYLSDYRDQSYNLQFIRFIAAVMVIFHQSFPLASGSFTNEWLNVVTNGQLDLGALAVSIFFLCGGYFAAQTVSKKKCGFIKQVVNRYVRLAKPLLWVVLVSILAGSILSTYSLKVYFLTSDTWKYLLNIFFIPIHNLPGVFENNIYIQTVNGALWTLPLEFLCFVACVIANQIKILSQKRFLISMPFVVIFEIIIWSISNKIPLLGETIRPTLLFYIGILFFIFKDRVILSRQIFIITLVALCLSSVMGLLFWGILICFPYSCFYIWFNKKQVNQRIASLGDYSYAMYLWGFPIQQLIVHLNGGSMGTYINFLISIPIVFVLGIFTNTYLEKKNIRFLWMHL